MGVKERIQQYADLKGISTYRLEADLEMSKGYWSKTKNISAEVASKFSRVYSDISTDWLMRGEGEMLNGTIIVQNNENGDNINGESVTIEKNNNDEYMKLLTMQSRQISKGQEQVSKAQEQMDRLITLLERR